MKSKPPRPESERNAAVRLTEALKINICRATVRRLKAKGIPLHDLAAIRHSLAMQERQPPKIAEPKPATNQSDQPSAPMTSAELDQRLASLEHDLLIAPDYETARCLRVKISGYRELVRVNKDRGHLIDRGQVEAEGHEAGLLFRHACMRFPAELLPRVIGLDYPDAHEVCEEWIHQLLTSLHELTETHLVTILKEMGFADAKPRHLPSPAKARKES